ncbi:hypothetical protein ANCCAN_26192 [Ancylostoma caninum]|uniref:Secreted protein n=1 Tax=Ancylostoma caninum TaxID=29170 RepID=A0A368FAQ3_ANCCA|nr:hypothetical protein ANCCAN_26192 [Ancylostoma caninum]
MWLFARMVADLVTVTMLLITCSGRKGSAEAERRTGGKSIKTATVERSPKPRKAPSINREVDPTRKSNPATTTKTTSMSNQEGAPRIQDVRQSAEESNGVR